MEHPSPAAPSGTDEDRRAATPLDELDDHLDRAELRGRYEIFLQELRVVLPGVQVLLAFLWTVPFSQRFEQLSDPGRQGYAITLLAASVAVICFVAPSVFHRVAHHTARTARLRWGLRFAAVGFACLAVALVAGLWTVTTMVYSSTVGWVAATTFALLLLTTWVAIPLLSGRNRS